MGCTCGCWTAWRGTTGRHDAGCPPTAALAPPRARVDSALVKALGRAFRWRRLLDTGAYATIEEIAAAEGINPSYVSRVLRMTLLAPDLVEAALAGRQPEGMTLAWAMGAWPGEWEGQRGECGR